MAKRTRIVLPSSDHVVIIKDDVRDEDLSLTFQIDIECAGGQPATLYVESETNLVEIHNRLEYLKENGAENDDSPLGDRKVDNDYLIDDWPRDDDGDILEWPEFDIYWIDADHVVHDVVIEHIGEVHAEETELEAGD